MASPLPTVIINLPPKRAFCNDSLSDICRVTDRGSFTAALYNILLIVKNWLLSTVASISTWSAKKSDSTKGINLHPRQVLQNLDLLHIR